MLYFDYQVNVYSELFPKTCKKAFFSVKFGTPFDVVLNYLEKYYTELLGKKPIMSIKFLRCSSSNVITTLC